MLFQQLTIILGRLCVLERITSLLFGQKVKQTSWTLTVMDYLTAGWFSDTTENQTAAWNRGDQCETCWRIWTDQQECDMMFLSPKENKLCGPFSSCNQQHGRSVNLWSAGKGSETVNERCFFFFFLGVSREIWKKSHHNIWAFADEVLNTFTRRIWASSPSRLYPDWTLIHPLVQMPYSLSKLSMRHTDCISIHVSDHWDPSRNER